MPDLVQSTLNTLNHLILIAALRKRCVITVILKGKKLPSRGSIIPNNILLTGYILPFSIIRLFQ